MACCAKYLGGGEGQPEEGCGVGLALIKFTASWCGPCRAIHPEFLRLSQSCIVPCWEVCIESEEGAAYAEAYEVKHLPTFLLLQDGRQVEGGRVVGVDLTRVRRMLDELLVVE